MKASSPQIEHLKLMLSLEEKRADLQSELTALDAQLSDLKKRLVSGSAAAAPAPAPKSTPAVSKAAAPRKGKRSGRGELKGQIFAALERAGAVGVKVLELAKELGTKPANIYAWFHAGIKRYPSIKKTGGGSYRLVGKAPVESSATVSKAKAPAKAPAAKASAKAPAAAKVKASAKSAGSAKGATRAPRGQLSEQILGALKSAGSNGMNIKDLSEKLGAPYRNLQVWFATTGKKNGAVKKIRPATYRLA